MPALLRLRPAAGGDKYCGTTRRCPGQVRDALRRWHDKACAAAGETCFADVVCAAAERISLHRGANAAQLLWRDLRRCTCEVARELSTILWFAMDVTVIVPQANGVRGVATGCSSSADQTAGVVGGIVG